MSKTQFDLETSFTEDLKISDSDHKEMCRRFWELDDDSGKFTTPMTALGVAYGLSDAQVKNMVESTCIAYKVSEPCEVCDRPERFRRRIDYKEKGRYGGQCVACYQNRDARIALEKFELIQRVQLDNSSPINTSTIPFRLAAFLLAFLKYAANEDLTAIWPLSLVESGIPLGPTPEYAIIIIQELRDAGIITLSPDTPPDKIMLKEKEFHFNINDVVWDVSVTVDDSLKSVYERLTRKIKTDDYLFKQRHCIKDLCNELSLAECVRHLEFETEKYRLPYRVGEKTKQVLVSALESFPAKHVCYFIWMACTRAAADKQQHNISGRQAANRIPGKIERSCVVSIAYKWNIKGFRRNQQSSVSQVVFNTALNTFDGGFEQPISELIESIPRPNENDLDDPDPED
jgi:hypothetical protein